MEVACPRCGGKMSSAAEVCPHCQYIKGSPRHRERYATILLLALIASGAGSVTELTGGSQVLTTVGIFGFITPVAVLLFWMSDYLDQSGCSQVRCSGGRLQRCTPCTGVSLCARLHMPSFR